MFSYLIIYIYQFTLKSHAKIGNVPHSPLPTPPIDIQSLGWDSELQWCLDSTHY